MGNMFLQPILEQLKRMASVFSKISSHHVYQELNTVEESMSKEGLLMD
jgi:hypothetical protein